MLKLTRPPFAFLWWILTIKPLCTFFLSLSLVQSLFLEFSLRTVTVIVARIFLTPAFFGQFFLSSFDYLQNICPFLLAAILTCSSHFAPRTEIFNHTVCFNWNKNLQETAHTFACLMWAWYRNAFNTYMKCEYEFQHITLRPSTSLYGIFHRLNAIRAWIPTCLTAQR